MSLDWDSFEKKIGYTFVNKVLLQNAFTHRSYINEHRAPEREHNERLEFLGDAVLELAATVFLYNKYPQEAEGTLTMYRAALVNTQSIADAASALGMNNYLFLSRGEARDNGRARNIILANAFEALIGAIFVDGGYEPAERFIGAQLYQKTEDVVKKRLWQDAKSRFQENSQEKCGTTPTYKLVSQSGPDHDKVFTIGAYIGEEQIATGEGKSKQEAEQSAAEAALVVKGW